MASKAHNHREYKSCKPCRGTGKLKIRLAKLTTPDCKRMLAIMKKHGWTQTHLASVIGVSQGCVSDWFYADTNQSGTIKKLYFNILKTKGFI